MVRAGRAGLNPRAADESATGPASALSTHYSLFYCLFRGSSGWVRPARHAASAVNTQIPR